MPSRLTVVLVSLLLATASVAFWLWLVILAARVAILCPEGCNCDTGGYSVQCVGTSSNPLPLTHLTHVRQLLLRENNITLLQKDSFVSLTELEVLRVHNFGLSKIEVGAFNGLTKLKDVSIIQNTLRELKTGIFGNMKSLEFISISGNELEHLDFDVFCGLINLKFILFSEKKLQYLHPDTFLGLPNLQSVYIYDIPSLQIPTGRNFINSHSLPHLSIIDCNVSSVSVETFANVSALEGLYLSYNNLRTVDINILRALPKLSTLYLDDNPLHCDCHLQEVWRWCEDHNIKTSWRDAPQCNTPSEVEGMGWGVLQKGQCLEGNIQYYGDYKNTTYRYPESLEQGNSYEFVAGFLKQYQVPVYVVPFIFGTTGNVTVLIIIIFNKDMRTHPNMYILNLAISDIICLMVLFSEAVAKRIYDKRPEVYFMCIYFQFFRRMSVGLSPYSIALYSIQRYRVTINPIHVRLSSPPTRRGIVASFCGVWIVAALFAVPSALSKNMCEGLFYAGLLTYYQHVVIFELLVYGLLPLCVVTFTYIMTARHLLESSRSISEGTQNPQLKTRRKTAKIVVGLTVVFVISYVPYHTFWTYFICSQSALYSSNITSILDHSNYKFQYSYLISNCFLLINPCLNPVALFCTSSLFRQHLKRFLTCFCKTNSPPTDLELARRI